ncbi:hypothetical protein [Hymenobacter koreensis]|uniref:Roadblock/LAMTOR2 domain-containing protein n=1 Tax=Hymenobacter koreensis TaxID=1084523 RepID=A0ABP8JIR2_9BACT
MKLPFFSRAKSPADPSPAATVVQNMLRELPELIAVAVGDVSTGRTLASHTTAKGFNPAVAVTYNAAVIREKRKATVALQLTTEHIDDILITLTTQLHLLRVTPDGQSFLYLVVSQKEINLAIARAVLRQQAELFAQ